MDELRSDRLVDGVSLDNLPDGKGYKALPGQKHSSLTDGSRTTRPEIVTSALRFSPTGRDWSVVSTQGLQIFSLDDAMLFAPTDLDVAITPQAVFKAIFNWEYSLAVNMALHLGEREVLKKAVDSVPLDSIDLVVKTIDGRMLKDLLKFVADEIVASRHTEFYLQWCWHVLHTHGAALTSALNSMAHLESVRALIRAISSHEKEIMRMSDENGFSLEFLTMQMVERDPDAENAEVEVMEVEGDWNGDVESAEAAESAAVTHEVSPEKVAGESTSAVVPSADAEEDASSSTPASKKAKKAKKLTIQTTSERAQVLEALHATSAVEDGKASDAVAPEPEEQAQAQEQELEQVAADGEDEGEERFVTPGKAKKDKKAAKSASKSLLKSANKRNADDDDEEMGLATADRRVSFSHPLSMVKIISPIDSQRKSLKNGSGKKSASKKRLWSDDA